MILKKLYFISLLFIILPISSFCQFQIGIKGGYNYFSINDNYQEDPYDKYSYQGSFNPKSSYSLSTFFKDYRFKQPVMAYDISYKSYSFGTKQRQTGPGSESNIDLQYHINYLFFTFSPEFVFGSKWKFYINPGIFYGRLINCSATGTIHDYQWPTHIYDTLNGEKDGGFSNSAFGVKVGFGLEIPINKNYNFIFDNNYNIQGGTSSDIWGFSPSIFNASFEIGISYNFNKFRFPSKFKKK